MSKKNKRIAAKRLAADIKVAISVIKWYRGELRRLKKRLQKEIR